MMFLRNFVLPGILGLLSASETSFVKQIAARYPPR
jgi:hypothetical protein